MIVGRSYLQPILFVALLFSVSVLGETSINCQQGISAFGSSVHTKLVKDCMKCHGGTEPEAPPFAVPDVQQSYFRLLNYTNFQKPELSTVVIRAGNGHCKIQNCDSKSGTEMLAMVRSWWELGQKDCPLDGHYFTTELPVPELPSPANGFKKLEWDLTPFGVQYAGYRFQLEAQLWAKASATNPGAYRFRLPRISSGKKSLRIKDIRILINRMNDPLANAFSSIDQVTSPQTSPAIVSTPLVYPMLSAETVITNQITPDDKISISFDVFERAPSLECKAFDFFAQNIVPYFTHGMCQKCHGDAEGIGSPSYSSQLAPTDLCRTVRERLLFSAPMQSPFLKTVAQGKFGHPEVLHDPESFIGDLMNWVDQEK